MTVANTLTYFNITTITAVKSFVVQAQKYLGVNLVDIFVSCTILKSWEKTVHNYETGQLKRSDEIYSKIELWD